MSETRFYALRGGLDLVTPPIETVPGRAIAGVNYEPVQRGYRRVDGYERFDGRPQPSQAEYWVARFTEADDAILANMTVAGNISNATARVVASSTVESGSYVAGDAAGYFVITAISGQFQDGENLFVGLVRKATLDGLPAASGADTLADDRNWQALAIEMARSLIQPVPGSGPVRGVWMFKGEVYAFRDNPGATAGGMHKATPGGWSEVSLGRQIPFSAGSSAFIAGGTLTGGTSNATATILRVVLESGDWTTNDAAGRLILGPVTGAFQPSEAITGASGAATAAGADTTITLPAGGRYDFVNHNFYGSSDLAAMYGANSVGRAFEFDGAVFVPLHTGMVDDRPLWITVHSNHLFLGFRGGSVQHSSIGNPYQYQVLTGAGEIGIGEELTGLMGDVYDTLFILGRGKIGLVYGTDAEAWTLRMLTTDSGAAPWTAEKMAAPIYLDSIGVRSMDTTERFGDFLMGTLSQMVEPLFELKRRGGIEASGAVRIRGKDHYRLFWADGSGLTFYFGRGPVEIMPFLWPDAPACASEGKGSDGRDRAFFGAANGRVYEIDAGTSFDGQRVDGFIRLPFNHVGSPAQRKRWQKVSLELDASPDTNIVLVPEFGYADAEHPSGQEHGFHSYPALMTQAGFIEQFSVKGSGGFWEEANYDQFYWSSPVEGQAEAHVDGMGRNMSVVIITASTYEEPHTLTGMVLNFNYRGVVR